MSWNGSGNDRIDAARTIDPHGCEPVLPKHSKLLRHCRLRYAEFALHDQHDVARAMLSLASSSSIRRRTGSPRMSNACIGYRLNRLCVPL